MTIKITYTVRILPELGRPRFNSRVHVTEHPRIAAQVLYAIERDWKRSLTDWTTTTIAERDMTIEILRRLREQGREKDD